MRYNRVRMRAVAGLVLAATVGGVTACSGASPSAGSNTKGGGTTITVYSSTMPPVQAALAKAFTEKTGVQVKSLRLQSTALDQRFAQEYKAGINAADVLTINEMTFIQDASKQGMLANLSDVDGIANIPAAWKPNPYSVVITRAPYNVGYNTTVIKPNAVPHNMSDLLKPEYKGKILLGDPRTNPELNATMWYAIEQTLGDNWIRSLAHQDYTLVSSTTPGWVKLAAGDGGMVIPSLSMNLTPYVGKNAPLAVVNAFQPPPTGMAFYLTIPAKAKHAKEAREWAQFVLSPEGQKILNSFDGIGIGVSPLGDSVPGSLPAPKTAWVDPDPRVALARLPHILDLLGIGG